MAPRDISSQQWEKMFFMLQDLNEQPSLVVNFDGLIEEEGIFAAQCELCDEDNEHPIINTCTCVDSMFAHKQCFEEWIEDDIIFRSKCPDCQTKFPVNIQLKPISEVSEH